MFGFRSDGKKVKNMNIIDKAEPFFMPQRIDAVNYTAIKVPCAKLDEFIAKERRNGTSYSYMHLVIATIVRVLYIRKKLNRFVMRGTIYQRNTITISLDVKKRLEEDAESLTLKFYFTGRESIDEVKKIVDDEIAKNTKDDDSVHTTTKVADKFCKLPDFLFRWAMAFVRFLDRHGMLPKSLIHASPFHTSCFVTNLKSIKLGYIYHHLYNFGTTTIFAAMGKEQMEPYVENNKELKIGKFMTIGMSLDERIADGLYMGKSLKLVLDLLANPDTLMEKLPDDGTIPKKLIKRKSKKTKIKKPKKKKDSEGKSKKINPRKNKLKQDEKIQKANLKKQKKLLKERSKIDEKLNSLENKSQEE